MLECFATVKHVDYYIPSSLNTNGLFEYNAAARVMACLSAGWLKRYVLGGVVKHCNFGEWPALANIKNELKRLACA